MQRNHDLINLRYTEVEDAYALKEWLSEPDVRQWFAMAEEPEVIDAVNRWISFARYKCSLTATHEGVPCGIATLYLNPYKALVHQAEFGIVVAKDSQGKGVGRLLMRNIMHLAKNTFSIELLHLAVKTKNPAVKFYEKLGFEIYGEQEKWGKEPDGTYCARLLMQRELNDLEEFLEKTREREG